MKGIILAGGHGSRLHPVTLGVSKQLVPVYNKPMIYYPLSVLMLAGITDILIITTPQDRPQFEQLLSNGSQWGIRLDYAVQEQPRGLADAFIVGADHVDGDSVALILGDNIFHGPGLSTLLSNVVSDMKGCVLFGYPVVDPERYGVGYTDDSGNLIALEEKPRYPSSNRAITGLYFYDSDVVEIASGLEPSARGELEITDLNRVYLDRGLARLVELGRGFAWLDTGTHDSLLEASEYVRTVEHRQGLRIACLEEVALRMGYIDAEQCLRLGRQLTSSGYGRYVIDAARAAGAREESGVGPGRGT
ncbi:glucose-1-phosphate thymidylyltransferase RfbA [Jiangella anatolica]|uniref:Glucose-1-phosphate thymidylyltransferase n=1 Tax=Jiangella anatolica TaxID=2670374 RepID=A0A2W2C378_9ACTN|nr:glucose-1-phosphate thymidylyltransferase RfbA [Jiangella anatolica]PZF82427.1 glucose-1-phosphate thymidylyltransferase [Jiangella anatolica]